jgi:hypothetical protein
MNDNRIDVSCVVIYACGAIAREAPRCAQVMAHAHTRNAHGVCVCGYTYVQEEDTAAELMDLLPSPKPLARAAPCKTQINKHTLSPKLRLHFEKVKSRITVECISD